MYRRSTVTHHWAHAPATDRPAEDVAFVDEDCLAVADGVTRDRLPDGSYPEPSPAAVAARLFCEAVADLGARAPIHAFEDANRRIMRLNQALGLDNPGHVHERDAAGTVAAVARIEPHQIAWAYIADAGIALLDRDGRVLAETHDDVQTARQYFPSATLPSAYKRAVIRGHLRNHPTLARGGYGVLTGQSAALGYVRSGYWTVNNAHVCVVFSDGFRPLLRDPLVCASLASAVLGGEPHSAFVAACDAARQDGGSGSDEATAVAVPSRGSACG